MILEALRIGRRWKVGGSVSSAADLPRVIPGRQALLVTASGVDKWLAFDCPCRRGHRVMLPLDTRRRPRWQVREKQPLSLYPSVDELSSVGRCHYVIRAGRVHWVDRSDHRR